MKTLESWNLQAGLDLHFSSVVCSNCPGICSVTFFSRSALPSFSRLLISPKRCVLCVLFLGMGRRQGREEQRRPSRDVGEWNEVAVYSPCRSPIPFWVALECGLKQHQRPCTQITSHALKRLDERTEEPSSQHRIIVVRYIFNTYTGSKILLEKIGKKSALLFCSHHFLLSPGRVHPKAARDYTTSS